MKLAEPHISQSYTKMLPISMLSLLLVIVGTMMTSALSPVNLLSAKNYAILIEGGITTGTASKVVGKMAVSPAVSTSIVGFALVEDGSNQFFTSPQVIGKVYASDNATPTPVVLQQAVQDFEAAYTHTANLPGAKHVNIGAGVLGGNHFKQGLYNWNSAVNINSNIYLTGTSNSVFIFQINGAFDLAANTQIVLTGGVRAKNVFWQVGGAITLGGQSKFVGIILGNAAITLSTGASVKGRIYGKTALTMNANLVSQTH